ncbi:MAG: PilZ domain-containing protein [Planctomycetaceae bacterium]|nr:PilZ domain-containing protein [Planctomycetaceae bacterium]
MERRREARLRYSWPIWFAEDFDEILTQGQMVDVSSSGAAFTCYADRCPTNGEYITARFSVPRLGADEEESFNLSNFIRDGRICRIDELGPYVRRVAVQFCEPLSFEPAAQTSGMEPLFV